jgi:hypothetical protein
MVHPEHQQSLDEAFERIEETILPCISMMLDTLLDAVAAGQSGMDSEIYAAELRTIALQLDALTKQVDAVSPKRVDPQGYRLSAAAIDANISA